MLIINISIILLFVALGIVFGTGRGLDLVAGYNTLSKQEKEKIDKKALCRHMSRLMFMLSACWVVLSVGVEIEKMWLFWLGFFLFLGVAIFYAIYLNTGDRAQKSK